MATTVSFEMQSDRFFSSKSSLRETHLDRKLSWSENLLRPSGLGREIRKLSIQGTPIVDCLRYLTTADGFLKKLAYKPVVFFFSEPSEFDPAEQCGENNPRDRQTITLLSKTNSSRKKNSKIIGKIEFRKSRTENIRPDVFETPRDFPSETRFDLPRNICSTLRLRARNRTIKYNERLKCTNASRFTFRQNISRNRAIF